ncbi:MAG: SET domain-containing protein [Bacteroidota bacterium]|nr:SET domain-containing protein [Bacteroidota bacterium]
MIHPKTKLVYINDLVGYGLFATEFIPEGTITYVKDALEIEIPTSQLSKYKPEIRDNIEKYSYRDEKGNMVLSWDMGKYVNHCCTPNTISTGYGFEIAIRDIFEGEQVTDEYGIFNLEFEMMCECGSKNCRKIVQPDDFDNLYPKWDDQIQQSIKKLKTVEQPLWAFLDEKVLNQLFELSKGIGKYRSVYTLRYKQLVRDLVSVKR